MTTATTAAPQPAPVPHQRTAPAGTVEAPTERTHPPAVPPGVESPITVYGFTFDPDDTPIGARLAAETTYPTGAR